MTAANGLLELAAKDLTLEQVNHSEREGVLSIAFSLAHVVGGQDRNVGALLDKGPALWESGGWAKRVGYTGEMPQRGTPMSVAQRIRFTDIDAWRQYQTAVFARTGSAIVNTPLARFDEVVFDERPVALQGSFLVALVPSGPIRLLDVLEAWLYQHAVRHIGEIEHARSLVGLGGLT
jgi:hypothetical protein